MDGKGRVAFKSNLFGSLGAGMFVAPNIIDFGTIFQNVDQKILANLAVFIVVIFLVVLYVPGVVICRKQDKLDLIKVKNSSCLSLNGSCNYEITFCNNMIICTCLLLLILMIWHRQAIFESKGDKLPTSAECRIWSWKVWDTKSPADWIPTHKPTELSRIKLNT